MSKLLDLVARVKALTASHAELKAANTALMAQVATLTAQGIADDATIAELLALIEAELDAPGGSTGNM